MESDVDEVRCCDEGRRHPFQIINAKASMSPAEEIIDVFRPPAGISELEDVARFSTGQCFEKSLQPLSVQVPPGRELEQDGAQMALQSADTREQSLEGRLWVFEPLDVGNKSAGLDGEDEGGGDPFCIIEEHASRGQTIEGPVDLYRRKYLCVVV